MGIYRGQRIDSAVAATSDPANPRAACCRFQYPAGTATARILRITDTEVDGNGNGAASYTIAEDCKAGNLRSKDGRANIRKDTGEVAD